MVTTHEPLYSEKTFGTAQDMGIHTRFTWIIILYDEAFKHDNVAKFWGYVETTLNQSAVVGRVISL